MGYFIAKRTGDRFSILPQKATPGLRHKSNVQVLPPYEYYEINAQGLLTMFIIGYLFILFILTKLMYTLG